MAVHVFTGFGFGPIQSGLFVNEAFKSGSFSRIVIAEVDQRLVDAVRANKGSYYVNVARKDRVDIVRIDGIEIFNPTVDADRAKLVEALRESTEIVTSLPSVKFFDNGTETSVAALIAAGLKDSMAKATIIYTAENNNHAAEALQEAVSRRIAVDAKKVQFLNTVIGKMSQVVVDAGQIAEQKLERMVPGIDRAFLVEEFNHILVTRCKLEGFRPGITVFSEKDDLLPFEEAKLYGHNAIHALLAYLGATKGYKTMTQLKDDTAIMKIGRDAFINESGAALIKKYSHLGDELFTVAGFKSYAEDLLERMTNPYLDDAIERAGRDPLRKLSYDDRIFGTMALALQYGIAPENMAFGALAGIGVLLKQAEINKLPESLRFDSANLDSKKIAAIANWLWSAKTGQYADKMIACMEKCLPCFKSRLGC